jgi:anti-sigma factor RsiW
LANASTSPITDADVHAYADGQIAPERIAAFDAAIARDPAFAARVADIRSLSAALRDALDPSLAEPVPSRLLHAATPPLRRRARVSRWIVPALGLAATLAVGVSIGWFGRDAVLESHGTPVSFARQAAFAHALYAADARRPVEVWANEEKNLYAWLTKRLGHAVHPIDLSSVGFSLVGGRLVAGSEQPTALLMYENPDKQRLTLQIRWDMARSGETAFRYAVENGIGVFYWIDDERCGYAISGNVERAQLLAIARLVYGQLSAAEVANKPAS